VDWSILSAPRAARPSEDTARGDEHALPSIPDVFASVGGVLTLAPPSAGERTAKFAQAIRASPFRLVDSVPPFVNSKSRLPTRSPFLSTSLLTTLLPRVRNLTGTSSLRTPSTSSS